ncbi:MAG: hypothetical protein K2Y16_14215 [Burkholderiales bacterium]|nr:hypothetical protein [Burkholderiales bacterium]MBY0576485.1 hypothetical protein [Gallionellaceae bacterium]
MAKFIFVLMIMLVCPSYAGQSTDSPFTVRGAMPWHNFLSGPTAWNEKDYERYLDWMQSQGLNLLVLHNYTGGTQRYMNYVEPMIRIEYRNVLPEAGYDTSLTARWGYRPMEVKDFAFGTGSLFKLPPGATAFGSDAAVMAKTPSQRYEYAQSLIRQVIQMAHARGIRVAMGFEFGVYPPELFSVVPFDSYMSNMLPDPTHPASLEILYRTIDDLLVAYPGLDQIWLWLQEHEVNPNEPLSTRMQALMDRDGGLFPGADRNMVFRGVWSLAYIRAAHDYLKERSPDTTMVIGGWGGKNQLEGILAGLDRGLPKDIVFTCLNPLWGQLPQPAVLGEIAKRREVWVMPWLEGDYQLWHPQERVSLMHDQVLLARKQGARGVIAVHWRTEDIKANFEAFALFARNPDAAPSVDAFYKQYVKNEYGDGAVKELAPLLIKMDKEHWFAALTSPEYLPYDPAWGRLNEAFHERYKERALVVGRLREKAPSAKFRDNLAWLDGVLKGVLLLDEVSAALTPAYHLREQWLLNGTNALSSMEITKAKKTLESAPVEDLFKVYASRVRSRGELGVLSSMNQKLWLQYLELKDFLGKQERELPPF